MSDANTREQEIAAREADILGKPQRIKSLSVDELNQEARELVASMRKSINSSTTEISDVFGLMLRNPGLFRCQMETAVQLMGKGHLSPRERELAVLRVGWWCRAPYEWGEHVRVAKRYEITDEEIERVTQGSAAPGWGEHDRAVLRAVEELLGDYMISDETWATLAKTWGDDQLLEFPYLVGQYFITAIQQNSLRVRLDKNNIGLRQR